MRALVTGASGSLGRAVLGRLRDDEISVRAARRQPPTTWPTRTGEPAGNESNNGSRSSYRDVMFAVVTTVILYVFGFVFLYGVIRLGVRHAFEDLELQRAKAQREEELAAARDRSFMRDNAFLAGS